MADMELFNKAVATILGELYEAFPRRVSLQATTLAGTNNEEEFRPYGDVVFWLRNEGYLTFELQSQGVKFDQVTLTKQGLLVLNSEPESLKEKVPLGKTLSNVAKSGTETAIKAVVDQVLRIAMGG